ncbi:hypothetical protein BO78DRAFT_413098 [Aspergillus sclerotiicarbonarius CBS 121057]|uniref:Cell wall protein n=1 Tax=Aspergillus sclerotiicarbonarius (strain CBS 121057 / IBT 28362) TaxID=1448318 RepID=A0A319ENW8_ASPSB|nr:hypothetical protein BO78DRAFT_413098 [Aspergillus sclerotiicarbonarius CBS 121057]
MPPTTKYITLFVALTAMASASWIPLFSLLATSAITHACPINNYNHSTGVDAIVASITTLANDYTTFDTSIKQFNGTQEQYDQGLACEMAVEKSLKHVIEVTSASEALDADQSQQLLKALKLPYPSFMQDLLSDIASKSQLINKLGKTADVVVILQTLEDLSDRLTEAVEEKVVAGVAKEVAAGRVWVDGLFGDAIGVYCI